MCRCLLIENCLVVIFCLFELVIVCDGTLQIIGQSIIGFAGRRDCVAAVLRDLTDSVDQVFNGFDLLLVVNVFLRQRDCDGRAGRCRNDRFTSCVLRAQRPEIIGAGFLEIDRKFTVFIRRHGLRVAAVDRRSVVNGRLRRDRRKLRDVAAAHFGMR